MKRRWVIASGKTALDLVTEPGRNRHEDTEKLLRELSAGRTGN
jgi:hypothetical protein